MNEDKSLLSLVYAMYGSADADCCDVTVFGIVKGRSIRVASMSRSAAPPVGGYEVEDETEEKAGTGDN